MVEKTGDFKDRISKLIFTATYIIKAYLFAQMSGRSTWDLGSEYAGLEVLILVRVFVFIHTLCMRVANAMASLTRLTACAFDALHCDKLR